MAKNVKILIQNLLHKGLTFPGGEGNPLCKGLWIKRLELLAVLNCRF